MKFTSLSSDRLANFRMPKKLKEHWKPYGCLWFSYKDAWERWLIKEDMNWRRSYKYKYEIDVDMKRIIILGTKQEVMNFGRQYGTYSGYNTGRTRSIDWEKVRKQNPGKSGIYIKKPFIDLAFHFDPKYAWFASFDMKGGAIWNDHCIRKITLCEGWAHSK